ncbi:extensin family protein [Sphingomonas sp. GC_Shp_3]|uniref:extensin-like domain-containing protein n=1 Tax=Sphingomonas sp. GC_Shp_3 TaxID=2937383 RepID=UPI00226AB298|nr:extensin family protein [Sphingomonas sp. GC_Shp_3]
MRTVRSAALAVLIAALLLVVILAAVAGLRTKPEDLPWSPLHLSQPVGLFTGRKIVALHDKAAKCEALLTEAGVRFTPAPSIKDGACGYDDGLRFAAGGARRITLSPSAPVMSCPVAAGLAMWEWDIVQPAAQRYLGAPVVAIEQLGTYNCRPIRGSTRTLSEHASADAIDVSAFRLADGTRITITDDWRGDGPRATFLHTVRNGACKLFATVLSPEYNALHHNHLHLDQAARGAVGWRACR